MKNRKLTNAIKLNPFKTLSKVTAMLLRVLK